MPHFTGNERMGRRGINYISTASERMGFIWRETSCSDVGFDGEIELVEGTNATALIIKVQGKAGRSYIRAEKSDSFDFSADANHLEYWRGANNPVILVVYDPEQEVAYWVDVKNYLNRHPEVLADRGHKIRFDKVANRFTADSAEGLKAIFGGSHTEAEAGYRQHIVERFGKLTLYSVTSDKPLAVDLEQVFVKLTATAQKRIYLTVKEESLQFLDDIQARKEPGVRVALYNRQPQVVTLALNEPLREHTHLAILGAPGSGKTTLLKYLALTFARRQAKQRLELEEDRLPLYLALRDLNKWLDAHEKQSGLPPQLPPALLPRFLTESYAQLFPSLNLPADFFARALVQKKCAVLLDGLDEIADSLKRVRAAEFVAACLGHYAGNRFVLTSRPRGYETACRQQLASACGECTIRDFDDEQIRRFAESWYLAVTIDREGDNPTARDHAKQSAEDLLGAVQTDRVRPLATNPLLLSILALIHQRGNRLPQRRVALYEECIEFLLGYWHQVKGGEAARELAEIGGLSRNEKRALLEPVALWLHERGEKGAEVSRAELEEQLARQFRELYSYNEAKARRRARAFVDIIIQHTGLLVECETGVFAFAHLTFQEFLAARALADTGNYWHTLRPRLHDPWWREVTLLLAGHLSSPGTRRAREDTAALLGNICKAGSWLEDVLHRDLLLAFRCLCDMEQLGVEDPLRRALAAKVFELWRKSGVWALRRDIIELFSYGAPTPVGMLTSEWLLALTQDGSDRVCSRAAEALGHLGAAAATPDVLTRLLALSRDPKGAVRCSAALALGELGAAAVTPEVLARLLALIQDSNYNVCLRAVAALGNLGAVAATPEVLARLLALIQDGNDAVSFNGTAALGELGTAAATPEVLAQLTVLIQDGHNVRRSNAAEALSKLGAAAATPDVLARLLALSQDSDENVRSRAAAALGNVGPAKATPEVLARLLALIQDSNDTVSLNAAVALSKLGAAAATPGVLARLLALSQDGNENVCFSAVLLLGKLGAAAATPEVLARLLALSHDANDSVRSYAAEALGTLGAAAATPDMLARLLALFQDVNDNVRSYAAEALGRLGPAAATPDVLARLLALFQDANDNVRSSAAEALGRLGPAAATPDVLTRLLKLLNQGNEEFHINVAWACGQLGAGLGVGDLSKLTDFWQRHLASGDSGNFGGEYQDLSADAYKQLKHLAAIHAALPPHPPGKSLVRKAAAPRPRKPSQKS